MKVGQRFSEKINRKTFLLHFIKLHFLIGVRKAVPRKRPQSEPNTQESHFGKFLHMSWTFPLPTKPRLPWGGGGGVSGHKSRPRSEGSRELPSWVGGQPRPWQGYSSCPSPALPPAASSPFLGSPIQYGMEFPGKQGTRGTFECTNGIKSIYIFMTTSKFQLVDRNGEM